MLLVPHKALRIDFELLMQDVQMIFELIMRARHLIAGDKEIVSIGKRQQPRHAMFCPEHTRTG
jgi:hypothetical protein